MKNFLKKHGQTPPRTSRLVESSGVILSKDVMKFRKKLQAQRDIKTNNNTTLTQKICFIQIIVYFYH